MQKPRLRVSIANRSNFSWLEYLTKGTENLSQIVVGSSSVILRVKVGSKFVRGTWLVRRVYVELSVECLSLDADMGG